VAWELVESVRDRGTTVILVTHSMEEAPRLCDRLIVMRAGRVVTTGSPAELVERATTGATVTCSVDPAVDLAFLDAVDGVKEVVRDGPHVTVVGTGPLLAFTAHALVEYGLAPRDLAASTPTLEDAYLGVAARQTAEVDHAPAR
jgi:ABC-2 type transport system ATP-binding protein